MPVSVVDTRFTAAAASSHPVSPRSPYVGLRPFDRSERSIFFGRDRDAHFLTDKIFSAKLTLLYARSGVGKSSILRTLVIPMVEEQHARVIYFDAWGGEDPYELLRSTIIELASKLGISDAGAGAPTLTEIVRLVSSADDKTLVLILDQFEEFLISHGRQLDPLRKELAALVRASNIDVRVVLSLRQEFLAALEPFRYEMLNLFQSTYLLDDLNDEGIRDAIEKPAHLFGIVCEPELLDRLIVDLRAQQDERTAGASVPIDLPMMQLVCSQLWEAALSRELPSLTLALYEELGGAEEILSGYVRAVMPRRWSDQRLTARLMKHLAPASGFKRPLSVADLSQNENLDSNRIQAELKRLGQHRILQSREFRGQELWELQHDAFIRVIAPWRDAVLRRARKQRNFVSGLLSVFVIATVLLGLFSSKIKDKLETYANAEGRLKDLATLPVEDGVRLARLRFDTATAYLLEKNRIDLLRDLLKRYGDHLPESYGLSNAEAEAFETSSQGGACESFCLHYSSALTIDARYFQQTWTLWARNFAEKWGIPVPPRLRLIEERAYPKSLVRFTQGELTQVEFRTPAYQPDKEVFLTAENFEVADGKRLKEFLKLCGTDCREIESEDGKLWVAPRWSKPVWKVAGRAATDGSGFPALLLALKLKRNPETLFTDDVMSILLDRVRQEHPQTVNEALVARGGNLRQDFAELLKLGRPLTNLADVLDALAACPQLDSAHAAARVDAELRGTEPQPTHLSGRGGAPPATGDVNFAKENVGIYQGSIDWLPSAADPVVVYIGRGLKPQWFDKTSDGLSPELTRTVSSVRDDVFSQFGVHLPLVLFDPGHTALTLSPNAFQVEVVNQRSFKFNGESGTPLDVLNTALRNRVEAARVHWITAEDVQEQRQLAEPAFRAWLAQRYSLTDQKLLMRAVIGEGPQLGKEEQNRKNENVKPNIPAEYTLRHQDWLLRSLVFWAQADDPQDAEKIAEDLRAMQRARLTPAAAPAQNSPVSRDVEQGVLALETGRIDQASRLFSRAISANRAAAVQVFLATYPQALAETELREFTELCRDPNRQSRYQWFQDLEDLLSHSTTYLNAQRGRTLGLCLLQAYEGAPHNKQAKVEARLLQEYKQPAEWPAETAKWLAVKILKEFDAFTDPAELRENAVRLLLDAVPRLNSSESETLLQDIDKMMKQPGPKDWKRQLMAKIVEVRPEPGLQLELASLLLAYVERENDLAQAVRLVGLAEESARKMPVPQSRIVLTWARLLRAIVLMRMSDVSLGNQYAQAETMLKGIQGAEFLDQIRIGSLLDVNVAEGHHKEAIAMTETALQRWPETGEFYATEIEAELLANDKTAAAETASRAMEKANRLEEQKRSQQLCWHYLREWARAYLAKDTAGVTAIVNRIQGFSATAGKAYVQDVVAYIHSGNEKYRLAAKDLEQQTSDQLTALLFAAALGYMMTNREPAKAEETARRFMETDHEYVPYIAMILYARSSGPAQLEAHEVLEARWKKFDRGHWKERLQGGDETAWREMLIGYYLKQLDRSQIFASLEDEQVYANSDLHALPMVRRGLLCEAYFYDALLAEVEHDQQRRRADLQKMLDTRMYGYIEYKLAKSMLLESSTN